MFCEGVSDSASCAEVIDRVKAGTTYPQFFIEMAVELAGFLIVFGYYREREKPMFVKVIWVILMLDFTMDVAYLVIVLISEEIKLRMQDSYRVVV